MRPMRLRAMVSQLLQTLMRRAPLDVLENRIMKHGSLRSSRRKFMTVRCGAAASCYGEQPNIEVHKPTSSGGGSVRPASLIQLRFLSI